MGTYITTFIYHFESTAFTESPLCYQSYIRKLISFFVKKLIPPENSFELLADFFSGRNVFIKIYLKFKSTYKYFQYFIFYRHIKYTIHIHILYIIVYSIITHDILFIL